ncbi:MAG: outer membrane protein assembly factor BamE [OCS116 cluster bacterium]|uniref:Outer membrane protein assembly factor BamE domain-containing protein n=1 Tax=OCS116 cluster bacterium TaxID=2030921 RepID=A0A2A4Z4K8_9PROT|nr:outer membrane protein assembly factor BamE [OCS116 cluster bacterium]
MKQKNTNKIRTIFALALLGSTFMLSACGTVIDQHGYVAQSGAVEDITVGMPKKEVNAILGSPSVTTTANGLSYYYISSKQDRFGLIGPKESERQVVAVHFGNNKRVKKIAHYGLQDGVVIDFISQTTPTYKKDLNFIQELFGGVGASTPGGGSSGGFADGKSINF